MLAKLESLATRYEELNRLLSDPAVVAVAERRRDLSREHSELRKLMEVYEPYRQNLARIAEAEELSAGDDAELAGLAREDLPALHAEQALLEEKMKALLVPKDPLDGKNIILEIRAGTGGEEAGLFARDLFQMYLRYGEAKGWKMEVMSMSPSEQGGFKEVIAQMSGREVYGRLRYESGVHRVQRVPATEAQGRIHTSAVTVAVLPEAEEVDLKIEEADLKIDVYRSGGAGGQSVNTTDSAVRVTHKPTGLVVICQDERSQHKNKAKALKILRSRLLDLERERLDQKRASMRKSMVGAGDRSEKIRTYNYPQNRVSDHRIGLTLYKLDRFMDGDMEEMIEGLAASHKAEQLAAMETEEGKN